MHAPQHTAAASRLAQLLSSREFTYTEKLALAETTSHRKLKKIIIHEIRLSMLAALAKRKGNFRVIRHCSCSKEEGKNRAGEEVEDALRRNETKGSTLARLLLSFCLCFG
jgi:hypothetical protein